jgi:hypothetical protein
MIRPARLDDLVKLHALVLEMHQATDYPARGIGVSETAAKALFRDAVMRNGRTNDGGVLLNVIEVAGELRGFMLGLLQRVYMIGDRLEAQDAFLYCSPYAPARAPERLIDAYIAWAESNPKVAEIALSFTNAGGVKVKKLARLYERKGFARVGEIWKRAGL